MSVTMLRARQQLLKIVAGGALGVALLVGWSAVSLTGEPTPGTAPTPATEAEQPSGQVQEQTVSLTQAVHFTDAKGQDVVVGPGSYRVDAEGTNRIRLVPAETGEAVVIDAVGFTHQHTVESPVPVTVPDPQQPDVLYLALVSPGGMGLEAIGTYSGVKPRDVTSPMFMSTAISARIAASQTMQFKAVVPGTTGSTTGTMAPPDRYPTFDLLPFHNGADDNGLLLNPQWGWQINNPNSLPDPRSCTIFIPAKTISGFHGIPQTIPSETLPAPFNSPCTTQRPTTDQASGFNAVASAVGDSLNAGNCGTGHHNWAKATYEGRIYWEGHSAPGTDDDYNFGLLTSAAGTDPNNPGVGLSVSNGTFDPHTGDHNTPTGVKALGLEFDSDETIDHFHTPWWESFHTAVDESTSADAAANYAAFHPQSYLPTVVATFQKDAMDKRAKLLGMVNGKYAIVTGYFGLDCAHSCISELHPVWAMAIRVQEDPSDEKWAIFVRRWGNEGYCSSNQHYLDVLPNDTYTFRLPWRSGASSPVVIQATFLTRLGQAAGPMLTYSQSNLAALVSFTLPVPPSGETGEWLNGELHLRWPGAKKIPLGVGTMPIVTTRAVPALVEREDQPESLVRQLVESMTPAQRATFMAKIPPKPISKHGVPMRAAGPPRQVPSLPARVLRSDPTQVRSAPDAGKRAKDQQRLDALHAVYGPNIPGVSPQPR